MSTYLKQTHILYNVVDYTNQNVLSTYSLSSTPLKFIPDFTTSNLLSGTRVFSNKILRWDFGDGNFSNELTPIHWYKWPGQYAVALTVYDNYGEAYDSTYNTTINVYDFISTKIDYIDTGKIIFDIPAGQLSDPIDINTYSSWQNTKYITKNGFTVNLYASGARGDYEYIDNVLKDKWTHLRSLSRFYTLSTVNNNASYTPIDKLYINPIPVYANIENNNIQICEPDAPGALLVGLTGTGRFWYTDDRPGQLTTEDNPIFIFATLDNKGFNDSFTIKNNSYDVISYPPAGYQTIEPVVISNIKIRFNPAARLTVTTTGIDGEGNEPITSFDIPVISWQNTDIPYIVKFKNQNSYTTKNYPPLSSSSVTNVVYDLDIPYYNLQTGILYKDESGIYQPLSGVTFYEDFNENSPQSLGAFYKGFFIPTQSSENCVLTASITLLEPVYYAKDALVGWISVPSYSSAFQILRSSNYSGFDNSVSVSFIDNNPFVNTETNFGIYGITVAPSGATSNLDYQTWFADAYNDTIIKYDIYGNLQSLYYTTDINNNKTYFYNIPLSAAPTIVNNVVTFVDYRSPTLSIATPTQIALDSYSDLWVSLVDSGYVLKINNTTGYIVCVAVPSGTNLDLSLSGSYNQYNGVAGDGLFEPSSVDTDLDNNIWVCYTNPASAMVIKYRGIGNFTLNADILNTITFPTNIVPDEVFTDRNRNVWVTTTNYSSNNNTFDTRNDLLYKFDIEGNLLPGYPLSGFKGFAYITIDVNQNAWIAHGRNLITRVDGLTNVITNYSPFIDANNTDGNITDYICSIGGITSDTANNLWVINNFSQKLCIFDIKNATDKVLPIKNVFELNYPTSDILPISSYNTPIDISNLPYSSTGVKEFRAYGDWNGFRWINKYSAPQSTVRTITGSSNLFNIYPSTGKDNISKLNENWNASGYYNNLRYQESLVDKNVFFNDFLGVILGNISAQPYELGKTIYEKIANFTDNNADISKCNLETLLAFCAELSVEFENYNYLFPPQLRRLIDLYSIKQSLLWGGINNYSTNFDKRGTQFANGYYGINLGSKIDINTGIITVGTPIVAFEKFSQNYLLTNTNLFDNIGKSLPLSSYSVDWGWNLVDNNSSGVVIGEYYDFYQYIPVQSNVYQDGIIDWTNTGTTLSPVNSSFESWSKTNGIVQTGISYELTKGMKLFTSAANIVYNS